MGAESLGSGVGPTTTVGVDYSTGQYTYDYIDQQEPVSLQFSLELTAAEVGVWWLLFLLASGYAWRRWSTKTR